jgi:hypothetical protein
MGALVSPSDGAGGTNDDYSLPYFMNTDEVLDFSNTDATPDYQSTLLNEEVITLGLVTKWKQKKGFDYAEDFAAYMRALEQAISRDGGRKTLSLTKSTFSRKFPNVPESGFGS